MNSDNKLPYRIVVSGLKAGRYKAGSKPLSWDERVSGVDIVIDADGREIELFCEGDQSTPDAGWELLLNGKNNDAYTWTLYGVKGLS